MRLTLGKGRNGVQRLHFIASHWNLMVYTSVLVITLFVALAHGQGHYGVLFMTQLDTVCC